MKSNQESRENWRDEKTLVEQSLEKLSEVEKFAFGALVGGILTGIVGYLLVHWDNSSLLQIVEDFYTNISTELVSIFMTLFIIDRLLKKRSNEEEKRRLILQMGSPDNGFALEAVRQLKAEPHNWLFDGTLRGKSFYKANLIEAELEDADMSETDLSYARLNGAILRKAKLQGSYFGETSLSNADLSSAKLQNSELVMAKLADTMLLGANLSNSVIMGTTFLNSNMSFTKLENVTISLQTSFFGADLFRASFVGARLDETTILPDGSFFDPSQDTIEQLSRFTDENHPEYWRP